MLTRNGSCVIAIANTSAGSSGSRRRHGEEKGSPTFPFLLFPLSVSSAGVVGIAALLLDRSRRDLLALADRGRVLRRTGDDAREELGAPVADILELWDADVLHTR